MHVLLIANFALDRQESMQRFGRQLADGLTAQNHAVTTWSPEPRFVRLLPRYRYGGFPKLIGYLDKFIMFPRQVRRRLAARAPADIVHIVDHANAIYAPLFRGFPTVGTCHDVLQIRAARGEIPQQPVSALGRRYQRWILRSLAQLPHVVTPSEQTARELRQLVALPAERMTVVPMGLSYPYRRIDRSAAWCIIARLLSERGLAAGLLGPEARGFILHVGGNQWYKNRRGLLEIHAGLRGHLDSPPRLVMVGKPLPPSLVDQAHSMGIADDVVPIPHATNEELQALYSAADALVYPSLSEGFGWPVAEAQACGCPVFTSNRPPMTEVGGDGAFYFDPTDPARAATAIAAAWNQREQLRVRAEARAAEWDPARMIERYVEVYHRAGTRAEEVPA